MGIYNCKFRRQDTKILIHGLDAAGKTTILYFLTLGEVVTSIPTIGFNVEKVQHNNLTLLAWDVGGRDKSRKLMRHYFPNTNSVVFIIDSTDKERFGEVSEELERLLQEDELSYVPFLLLANKQDLESAHTLEEVKEGIGYNKLKANNYSWRPMEIFGCSAVTKDGQAGLYKALDWLCEQIAPSGGGYWFWPSLGGGNSKAKRTEVKTDSVHDDESKNITNQSVTEKKPWKFSSYVKGTVESFKSALPSIW